jgi:hypothetical protein
MAIAARPSRCKKPAAIRPVFLRLEVANDAAAFIAASFRCYEDLLDRDRPSVPTGAAANASRQLVNERFLSLLHSFLQIA